MPNITYTSAYEKEFPWALPNPKDSGSAKCKVCPDRTFKIDTMGRTAFISHGKGPKHKERWAALQTTPPAAAFFGRRAETGTAAAQPLQPEDPRLDPDDVEAVTSAAATAGAPAQSVATAAASAPPRTTSATVMSKFLQQEQITRAEVLWCLHTVMKHMSYRAAADSVTLFPNMFPDSTIASKMQLQKDKVGYSIVFGLAPFFMRQLQDKLDQCERFSVGFDESLNSYSHKQQMDVMVRFWDCIDDVVCTRYLTSIFLQGAKSSDLRNGLKKAVGEKHEEKLLQVSMDGPNVNLKMLSELQAELREDHGTGLLDLGSCGLHVVHGSLKTGFSAISWEIKEFLVGLYYIFKDSPARRGHFTSVTGSDVFPLAFCFTRWTENTRPALRAISLLPNLTTWVPEVRAQKSKNSLNKKHRNFDRLERCLKDPLLDAKLSFFVSTAEMVEPFLTSFQAEKPLAPLLFRELTSLTTALMERVVEKSVLQKESLVYHVNVGEPKNLLPPPKVELGFSTKAAIRRASEKKKVPDAKILEFRTECQVAIVKMVEKIQERSPLGYKIVRGLSCLDPIVVVETPALAKSRIDKALEVLSSKNLISGRKADHVKSAFKALVDLPSTVANLKTFVASEMRLDSVWCGLLKSSPASVPNKDDFKDFLKICLTLFHGNASLERGFSLNKECIVVNQHEESLIGIRTVHDAVAAAGGVHAVEISKSMIHAMRNAHALHKESTAARLAESRAATEAQQAKRKKNAEIKELEEKRRKIVQTSQLSVSHIDERLQVLKK